MRESRRKSEGRMHRTKKSNQTLPSTSSQALIRKAVGVSDSETSDIDSSSVGQPLSIVDAFEEQKPGFFHSITCTCPVCDSHLKNRTENPQSLAIRAGHTNKMLQGTGQSFSYTWLLQMLVNPRLKSRTRSNISAKLSDTTGQSQVALFKALAGAKVCIPETVLFSKGKPELLLYTEKGVVMATKNPVKLALKEVAKLFNDFKLRRKEAYTHHRNQKSLYQAMAQKYTKAKGTLTFALGLGVKTSPKKPQKQIKKQSEIRVTSKIQQLSQMRRFTVRPAKSIELPQGGRRHTIQPPQSGKRKVSVENKKAEGQSKKSVEVAMLKYISGASKVLIQKELFWLLNERIGSPMWNTLSYLQGWIHGSRTTQIIVHYFAPLNPQKPYLSIKYEKEAFKSGLKEKREDQSFEDVEEDERYLRATGDWEALCQRVCAKIAQFVAKNYYYEILKMRAQFLRDQIGNLWLFDANMIKARPTFQRQLLGKTAAIYQEEEDTGGSASMLMKKRAVVVDQSVLEQEEEEGTGEDADVRQRREEIELLQLEKELLDDSNARTVRIQQMERVMQDHYSMLKSSLGMEEQIEQAKHKVEEVPEEEQFKERFKDLKKEKERAATHGGLLSRQPRSPGSGIRSPQIGATIFSGSTRRQSPAQSPSVFSPVRSPSRGTVAHFKLHPNSVERSHSRPMMRQNTLSSPRLHPHSMRPLLLHTRSQRSTPFPDKGQKSARSIPTFVLDDLSHALQLHSPTSVESEKKMILQLERNYSRHLGKMYAPPLPKHQMPTQNPFVKRAFTDTTSLSSSKPQKMVSQIADPDIEIVNLTTVGESREQPQGWGASFRNRSQLSRMIEQRLQYLQQVQEKNQAILFFSPRNNDLNYK